MSESQSKSFIFLLCFIPLSLLIITDSFALYLQEQPKAISHLSFAVLIAQLLCLLVFYRGQICNGQRARLINVNRYLILYWCFWLILSLFSNYHYVLTDMVSLCGIGLTLAILFQPAEEPLRRSMLLLGGLLGILGLLVYGLIFFQLPWLSLFSYNIFGQILAGVILANLCLVIAKNRLQGFIRLLPLVMIIFLLLNGILSATLIYIAYQSAVIFYNELSLGLYFALHLILMGIIAFPILKNTKLGYQALVLLLFITISFPIWRALSFTNS